MPDLAFTSYQGRILPLEQACVSALDRGFLFADGVYELVRVYAGVPFLFEEHLNRLRRSLKAVQIPFSDFDLLRELTGRLIRESGYRDAKLYLQITRGHNRRQHAFDPAMKPTLFLSIERLDVGEIASRQEQGVKLITQPDQRWSRCDIKSIMLLPNVLALQAAVERGAYDALLVDSAGFVRECTRASFFAVLESALVVPPVEQNLLPGITRNVVLHLAERKGMPVMLRRMHLKELAEAEEAFVTATTAEIVPVLQVDGTRINGGKPGRGTRELQQSYRDHVQEVISRQKRP